MTFGYGLTQLCRDPLRIGLLIESNLSLNKLRGAGCLGNEQSILSISLPV